jgi:hypothetical protein
LRVFERNGEVVEFACRNGVNYWLNASTPYETEFHQAFVPLGKTRGNYF